MESIKLVTDRHYLGVEIEIEKASTLALKRPLWWDLKADNSLREGGIELVFKQPYKGHDAVEALKEAFERLLKPTKMRVSPRTGIHVHVDVRDLSLKQLRRMCVLYALTEEPLFKWVGDFRDSNSFCLPWYEAEGDIDLLCSILSKEKGNIHTDSARVHRYSAMNLNAISKFGSVEFRHLQTTFDGQRLATWINLLLCLKLAAISGPANSVDILKAYKTRGNEKFVKDIFGPFAKVLDPTKIDLGPQIAEELVHGVPEDKGGGFYAHMFKTGVPSGYKKYVEKHVKKKNPH